MDFMNMMDFMNVVNFMNVINFMNLIYEICSHDKRKILNYKHTKGQGRTLVFSRGGGGGENSGDVSTERSFSVKRGVQGGRAPLH